RLLRLLDRNGRTPTARLARSLGMSAPSVAERLRRLEESRVIRRFTVDVDPAALGYPLAAYIPIRPATRPIAPGAALAAELPESAASDRITGDDCLLARAHVRSVEELERLIDRITPFAQTNTSIIQSSPVERRLPSASEESGRPPGRPSRRKASP